MAHLIAAADPVKVYNACGKFNLNECADLVRTAKLVDHHDTGLMHIAAAYKRPSFLFGAIQFHLLGCILIMGLTLYERYFDVKKLWCRPCSKIGYDKCPLGHFKCMQKIPVDDIVNHVNSLLRKSPL